MYFKDLVYRPDQDTSVYEVMPYRPDTDDMGIEVLPYIPNPQGRQEVAEEFLEAFLRDKNLSPTAKYIPWGGADTGEEEDPAVIERMRLYLKSPEMQRRIQGIKDKYRYPALPGV